MKRFAVVGKNDPISLQLKEEIMHECKTFMQYDEKNPDLVITVGGDGTMLYSIHLYEYLLDTVCFVGIHTGTLGFLTDYQKDECKQLIQDLKQQTSSIYERTLLEVQVADESYLALNEVRIENNRRAQVLDVFINDEHLETFRGNGLCICTPSGSTAYNKSLNGAVIYPGVKLMELSEIAGIHHNAYRSLGSSMILDSSHIIRITSHDFKEAVLGVDQSNLEVGDDRDIVIKISDKTAKFISYQRLSFIQRVKKAFL